MYLKDNAERATDYLCDLTALLLCSAHNSFKPGHVQINMENGLKFKITHRWWELMMCAVACRGSPCAHCRNINGVFNCFWLRSVGWVWVKPIRRLEETVKNCLRKKAMTFWQTVYEAVCYCAHYVRLTGAFFRMCACECFSVCAQVSVCERASALWVRGRKCHMAYLITCCDGVQYLAFLPPPWNWKPWPLRKYLETEIRPRTLVTLGPKTERKAMPSSLVSCDSCGVEFHPIVLNSRKRFKMKSKAVSKIYDALHRCEASCSVWGWVFLAPCVSLVTVSLRQLPAFF